LKRETSKDGQDPPRLPDLMREGLEVIFVGINPSTYSVEQGHYFARKTNRFWPAFSRSVLSRTARESIGVPLLQPMHDLLLLDYGFGFTDAVKRPTPRASDLNASEFSAGVALLAEELQRYRPNVACFHGVTAYRAVHRALASSANEISLGPQPLCIGETRIFVAPNPSPANAHFTPEDQTLWYDRLAVFLITGQAGEAGLPCR
jgi:TDG/mug DNA glycosylase family protein